ncbi:MAG: hypothetical protein Q9182_000805 [Xanthomendoza sp. 2 TL-2023]
MCCTSDILLAVLAIIFPPIAVWIKSGICTLDSLINILLCALGYIPGLLHAWYIIAKYPEDSSGYEPFSDVENQHVTYYYVNDSRNNSNAGLSHQQGYARQGAGEGPSQPPGVPPSYEQAIAGDNKVQS